MVKKERSENYGTQLEFFATFLFKNIFNNLRGKKISSRLHKFTIEDFKIEGSPKGGEQLTDIPLTLYLKDELGGLRKMFLYIESKAYFATKDISESDIIGSLNRFYIKIDSIPQGYGDCYIIFKPGNKCINKGGELDSLLNRFTRESNFLDYYFEISNGFLNKNSVSVICGKIKEITGNKKIRDDYNNSKVENICDNFFKTNDISKLQDYVLNEISFSITQFETSLKRKEFLLEEIKKIVINGEKKIKEDNIDISRSFQVVDNSMLSEFEKDKENSKLFLIEYVASKYRAFNKGYFFDLINQYEDKIGNPQKLNFVVNKNPIIKIDNDFYNTIEQYLDAFKSLDDAIFNEVLRRDWQTSLGLFFYLGTKDKCHIKYVDNKKIFTIGEKDND